MREEASFHMFFEKDDRKIPRKRKVTTHYEEGQAPVEFTSKVEEYYGQFFFIKQLKWLSPEFVINFSRKTTLRLFRQWKYCF